jgi:hypothetical protein
MTEEYNKRHGVGDIGDDQGNELCQDELAGGYSPSKVWSEGSHLKR